MICRLTEADAHEVHLFIDKTSKEDLEAGITVVASEDLLASQVRDGLRSWLAVEGGKIIGLLGPEQRGVHYLPDDDTGRAFAYFTRLIVDYGLYKTSRSKAIRVARELTVAAADDLQLLGPPDDIRVTGLTSSRGAAWCRLLGFEETQRGSHSEFWLPFALIWERCKATEALANG